MKSLPSVLQNILQKQSISYTIVLPINRKIKQGKMPCHILKLMFRLSLILNCHSSQHKAAIKPLIPFLPTVDSILWQKKNNKNQI